MTPFKQLPTKFAKLRRAVGESVEKHKNPFCGPAMLEKLKGALPPNSHRRSGREGFDRFHRFVVVQQFLGAIVKKWPSIYRENYDGRERKIEVRFRDAAMAKKYNIRTKKSYRAIRDNLK